MSIKSRTEKSIDYANKYGGIPIDFYERLEYMCDIYNIDPAKQQTILNSRNELMNSLYFKEFNIKLFEEPEGSERPRARVNRYNVSKLAKANSFIRIYSPCAKEDSCYMKMLMEDEEFEEFDQLITTPSVVDISVYLPTPKTFNYNNACLAEIGAIRPIKKPDWDNIGKKHTDMLNLNVWIDDDIVIDGAVHKYYSILPRVEINIKYLNSFYNKYQYDQIRKRKHYPKESELNYKI